MVKKGAADTVRVGCSFLYHSYMRSLDSMRTAMSMTATMVTTASLGILSMVRALRMGIIPQTAVEQILHRLIRIPANPRIDLNPGLCQSL